MKSLRFLSAFLLILISACSEISNSSTVLKSKFSLDLRKSESSFEYNPRKTITRKMVNASTTPLVLVEILNSDYIATIQSAPFPALADVWLTKNGKSLTTKDGVLVATRGFNYDLMGADVAALKAALTKAQTSKQPIFYDRSYRYLVKDNQDEIITVNCELSSAGKSPVKIFDKSYATTLLLETCQNKAVQFENKFWVQKNGLIRKSMQWHGINLEMILIERVI